MNELERAFEKASVGIFTSRRPGGIRLLPYCEIRSKDIEYLSGIKTLLLNLSVSCTVSKKGFLRIQGIQNCSLITQFVDTSWWLDAMQLFEQDKHLTEEGLLEIAQLREKHSSGKQILTRRTIEDIARIMAES